MYIGGSQIVFEVCLYVTSVSGRYLPISPADPIVGRGYDTLEIQLVLSFNDVMILDSMNVGTGALLSRTGPRPPTNVTWE